MSTTTKIEWAETTWNPLRSRLPDGRWGYHCERIAEGCRNCYAERMNGRKLPAWGAGLEYNRQSRDKVETFLDEKELLTPLRWRKPRTIFVCSMTDLFGEWVPDSTIDQVFVVMALTPQHRYIVLTKRGQRMQEYFQCEFRWGRIRCSMTNAVRDALCSDVYLNKWPLPNVALGVSAATQGDVDAQVPYLLHTPAACRLLSLEPQIEDVDLWRYLSGINPHWTGRADDDPRSERLDGVIQGGESGPGARPFRVEWARKIKWQCWDARVAYFLKQLGALPIIGACRQHHYDFGSAIGRKAKFTHHDFDIWRVHFRDRKGGDMAEWPSDLQGARELPAMLRAAEEAR